MKPLSKYIQTVIASVSIAVAIFASCKKSSSTNPVAQKLAGKWKNTYNVTDTNNNHVKDIHDAIDTINNEYTIEYYPDGTGALLLNNATAGTFKWQLLDNNTYLQQTVSGSGTTIQHIDSLTTTTLVLRDTTGISYVWGVFTKQ